MIDDMTNKTPPLHYNMFLEVFSFVYPYIFELAVTVFPNIASSYPGINKTIFFI